MPPKQTTLYLILDASNDALLAARRSQEDAELYANNTSALTAIFEVAAKDVQPDTSAQEAFEVANAERSREPITGGLSMLEQERRLARKD